MVFILIAGAGMGLFVTYYFGVNWGEVTPPDYAQREKLLILFEEERVPFSTPSAELGEGCNPRVVARILLGKARERSADVTAWLVTPGTHDKLGVARCASERRPAQFPVDRRCSVVLWDYVCDTQPALKPPQRGTSLWVPGLRKGGTAGFLYDAFPVTHSRTLTESFWAGETCLFYVEGDREFVAQPGMTVAEFAASNNGSFLVLTVKME